MNQYNLKNRVAVVTGGSRGIGMGIVQKLLISGSKVAIIGQSEILSDKASQEFKKLGETVYFCGDVKNLTDIQRCIKEIVNKWGKIDILVNNAGIATSAPIHEMTDEMWDELISIHLNGTFYATRECLKVMYEQEYGRIINTASQLAYKGSPGFSHYTAAKGAIISFTRSLSLEIGKMNIRANCVAPGATMTRMLSEVPTEILDGIKASIPKGTIANIEEIVPAYVFLASDDGDHFVGQTISPNGGDHFL